FTPHTMRTAFFTLFIFLSPILSAQPSPRAETAIRAIMARQEAAWNRGDLEAFMDGYWRSDSLQFIGSRGLTYGWHQTLDNYRKGYPDRAAMGTLTFTLLSVQPLSQKSAFVVGKWHLKRNAGDLSGHFTLLWKKIKGAWVIVADHSS
ncbi:MAG: YybH family protein, partial [Saprospiraceae bacterium]